MNTAVLRVFGILVLTAALTAPALATTGVAAKYRAASEVLLTDGRAAMQAQEYERALSLFESALVADPGSAEAMVSIGRAHEALGEREEGLRYYGRALLMEPNNRSALVAESLASLAGDAPEMAETNLSRLRRICGEAGCEEADVVARALADYRQKKGVAAADPDG